MAITTSVGGTDVKTTSEHGDHGLVITDALGSVPTCSFTAVVAAASEPYDPDDAVTVVEGGTTRFAGIITSDAKRPTVRTEDVIDHQITARGNVELFKEQHCIPGRLWTDTLAGDIVKEIVGEYVTGLTVDTTNVDDGPTVERFRVTVADSVFDAVEHLAAVASASGVAFWWRLDPDDDLYFKEEGDFAAAAFNVTTATDYDDLRHQRTKIRYANTVVVRGRDVEFPETTERIVGPEANDWAQTGLRMLGAASYEARLVGAGGPPDTYTPRQRGTEDESGADVLWERGRRQIEKFYAHTSSSNEEIRLVYSGSGAFDMILADAARLDSDGRPIMAFIDAGSGATLPEMLRQARAHLVTHAVRWREEVTYQIDNVELEPATLQTITLSDMSITGDWLITSVERRELIQEGYWRLFVKATKTHKSASGETFVRKRVTGIPTYTDADSNGPLRTTLGRDEVVGLAHGITFSQS